MAEAAATTSRAVQRALYLGFDATPIGAPVTVLLLVDQERDHDELAPIVVEALVGEYFVPVVVNDTTRALGESGLLSMSFAVAPIRRELFGKALTWLRLTPAASDAADEWLPNLRGAYLNAAWASAASRMISSVCRPTKWVRPRARAVCKRRPRLDRVRMAA